MKTCLNAELSDRDLDRLRNGGNVSFEKTLKSGETIKVVIRREKSTADQLAQLVIGQIKAHMPKEKKVRFKQDSATVRRTPAEQEALERAHALREEADQKYAL